MNTSSRVIAFIRGEADVDSLAEVGIEAVISEEGMRLREPPGAPLVVPTRRDVAHGLLVNYSRGTTFKDWASVVLAANLIDLVELETIDDDPLLETLWMVAGGEDATDEALAAARAVVER